MKDTFVVVAVSRYPSNEFYGTYDECCDFIAENWGEYFGCLEVCYNNDNI